jgi:putative hydrolase of the HAD superfamily
MDGVPGGIGTPGPGLQREPVGCGGMPAAYLLDLYDTLVSADWQSWWEELRELTGATDEQLAEGYEQTRKRRNEGAFESPDEEMRSVLEAGGIADPDGALVATLLASESRLGGRVVVYDDTIPTLAALREEGIRTAIVSNCNRGTRETVERLGLDAAVDAVVLSCELRAAKPDPRIYQAALDELGVQAADAIFVDDQTAYCDGARAVGIDTRLLVRADGTPYEGFAPSTNGHTVISRLADLL